MGQDYNVQEVQKNVPFQEGNSACERTFFLGHMVHKGLFSHFEKLYFIKKKSNIFMFSARTSQSRLNSRPSKSGSAPHTGKF